jgi:hypothetical protein
MRISWFFVLGLGLLHAQTSAPVAKKTPTPAKPAQFPQRESLRYALNWENGLSLGDGQLTTTPAKAGDAEGWEFTFQVQAAVPKFPVAEFARSIANANFCTVESEKNAVRGKRKTDEKTIFDQKLLKAVRQTTNGGKSELSTSPCAKDGLTFLNFLRHELIQGRLPQAQTVYYGAPYEIGVQYIGTQKLKLGDGEAEAERIGISIKGPAARQSVEVFFLKDAVRTPARVRVVLPAGTISMDLAR